MNILTTSILLTTGLFKKRLSTPDLFTQGSSNHYHASLTHRLSELASER